MPISWDIFLVFVSALVAILGAFTAFTHLRQMRETSNYPSYWWLGSGSLTLGLTIWAASYLGVLSLKLPIEPGYSPMLSILSGLPAIVFSLISFYVLRVPVVTIQHIVTTAVMIGIGLSVTQFTTLTSLQLEPKIMFNPLHFGLSAMVGIVVAFATLMMGRLKTRSVMRSLIGASVMGLGFVLVHFTVIFSIDIPDNSISMTQGVSQPRLIALFVVIAMLFWYVGSVFAVLLNRRINKQSAESLVKLQVAHEALDQKAQKLAKDRAKNVLDKAMDAVVNLDTQGRIIEWNTEAERIFGYEYDEVIKKSATNLIIPEKYRKAHDKGMARFLKTGDSNILGKRMEMTALRKNGEEFPIEIAVTPIRYKSDVFFSAFIRDISERKNTEQQIHRLAFFDSLTQLPNRRLLRDRLHQLYSTTKRNKKFGAVLLLDLDNFKTLNDSKGHEIGDMLLVEVAQRLQAMVRTDDTVARLGGDEFLILLQLTENANDAVAQAEMVAEKIRNTLSQPFELRENIYHTTPSIGIALFKDGNETEEDLLKHADTAMYQAKQSGRNSIRFYDPEMQEALEQRAQLEHELRQALSKQQFHLYYQVQVDTLRRPIGAEVLLRWERPGHAELSSPLQYITLAEDTNLIIPIGLWVLRTACAQLKAWQDNPQTHDLVLAVNISAKQFRQSDFVAQVQNILLDSGAKPSHLKLELTESTVLENVQDTIAKMRELKLLGVDFSMDDFGTGYSSLQYLKRLPLEQIKIDQSFVRDITTDPNDAIIVQTIIAMSEAMGLNVIAEGVETEEQMKFLDEHGCHTFQGYLFSRPIPVNRFEILLESPL